MSVIFPATLIKRENIAEGTVKVTFSFVDSEFVFKSGQYVRVTIPKLIYEDPRGNSRDFSIASSPNIKNAVSVSFRISQSGFKQTLIQSPLGIPINIEGPFGVFTLPEDAVMPVVFIAGGIGITPFLSMISFATEEKSLHKIMLLYVNHSPESSAFLEKLEELEKMNPNFSYRKHYGPLDEMFIRNNIENPKDFFWYIAGPPGMVGKARKIIMSLGAVEEKIRVEEFIGY